MNYSGIHHIGFEVESLEEIVKKWRPPTPNLAKISTGR